MTPYGLVSVLAAALLILAGLLIAFSLWRQARPLLATTDTARGSSLRRILVSYIALTFAITAIGSGIYSLIDGSGLLGELTSPFLQLILAPLGFAQEVLAILASLWIAAKVLPRFRTKPAGTEKMLGLLELDEQVRSVFKSDEFLTALSTALPRGEKDAEHGLDYIPYMLQSIEARRRRFAKSSQIFLSVTVVSGAAFSVVLLYLGYMLVNEAAAGTPRLLANAESELRQTREALTLMRGDLFNNPRLIELAGKSIQRLETSSPGSSNGSEARSITTAIATARSNGRIQPLLDTLNSASRTIERSGRAEQSYADAVTEARNGISQYLSEASSAAPRLDESTRALQSILPQIHASLEQPQASTAEVVRRIAVGLVVSTFLLAILRYVAQIYNSHHQQMLRAEADDLAVRRFYIAYKSTADNPDVLRSIVSVFLTGHVAADTVPDPQPLSLSKDEAGLIKDFLTAISKKL